MGPQLKSTAVQSGVLFHYYKKPNHLSILSIDFFYDETGNRMDKNKKSIAYSLTYRNHERTLKSAEVDIEHEKILSELRLKLPIEFR